jgi:radical SAM superfamily enzyme YgiQ (UPF0313 family)
MLVQLATKSAKSAVDPLVPPQLSTQRPRRVLFIYPAVRLVVPARVPPMGYAYLSAVLESAGMHVEILDLNASRMPLAQVMAEVRRRDFDVIGIGGMTTVYYYIKLLSLKLKAEFPQIPIIGGGSACSASPDVVLKNTGVDVCCLGEGEPIIVDLVERLASKGSLRDIPGIAYRNRGGEVIKTEGRARFEGWPEGLYPAHHLVDMETYIQNNAVKYTALPGMAQRIEELGLDPEKATRPVHIFSKRGCPFGCTFCYRNFGRKVVYDSIDHVLNYMEMLSQRYDTQHFVFGDELFNVSEKWVEDFCNGLKARGQKYLFSTNNGLRANCCTEESLRRMRDVGFYRVGIGIESFYDPSLSAMKKNQTAQQIKNAILMIRKVGLFLNEGGMLFGYETDGWDAMRANVEALTELGFYTTGFSIPCPYPGTILYDKAVAIGAITDEEAWLLELADRDVADRVINMNSRSVEELTQIIQWGTDQLAINNVRRKFPRIAGILDHAQPLGRKALGIDLVEGLSRAKRKTQRALDGTWARELLSGKKRKNYLKVELAQDGLNIVNKQGLSGYSAYDQSGDRYVLLEALTLLDNHKTGQYAPLQFLD